MEAAGGEAEREPPREPVHPPNLQNETPGFLTDYTSSVIEFLQAYGWFIVLGVVLVIFLKSKFQPYLDSFQNRRQQQQEYANYDPVVAEQRQQNMEAARRQMQEKFDAQAARFAEEQQVKEEEKRKARIVDWERHQEGKGYKSKTKFDPDSGASGSGGSGSKPKKTVYRNTDYSPLGGPGGGASFRPPRRGPSAGGG